MTDLTPKQQRFVEEYLTDLNATQAAIRAGYSEKTAAEQAHQLLQKTSLASAIVEAQAKRSERTEITQDMVLTELWQIASADPNELIQWRRGACPKCWGDPAPVAESLEGQPHGGALKRAKAQDAEIPVTEPNPDCESCKGEGAGRAYVFDTRFLTGPARKLYAGVKVSKQGLEVKMHDRSLALRLVGQHLGMFKTQVEHSGQIGLEQLIQESGKPPADDA